MQLENEFGDVVIGLSVVRGRLSSRARDGRDLVATGLAQAFTHANGRCLTGSALAARLADAEAAARFRPPRAGLLLQFRASGPTFPGDTDIPSPELAPHRLDEAAVATALCPRVGIDSMVIPASTEGRRAR